MFQANDLDMSRASANHPQGRPARHRVLQLARRVGVRVAARLRWEAQERAVQEARRQEEESFEAIKQEFGMEAGEIREVLALWQVRWGASGKGAGS